MDIDLSITVSLFSYKLSQYFFYTFAYKYESALFEMKKVYSDGNKGTKAD